MAGVRAGDAIRRPLRKVNEVLLQVSRAVEVDLWTLDALWWHKYVEGGAAVESITQPLEGGGEPSGGARFGLERHLQEFLRDNWDHTDLGKEWKLYEEDGDPEAGYEYPCGIGRIDLLARHRSESRWLVIELKRDQSSDQTVGQILRYIGWVKERMAEDGELVEGLIIAREADDSIRFALSAVDRVRVQLYEVDFRLLAVGKAT